MRPDHQKIAIVTVDYCSYEDTVRLVRSVSHLRWVQPIRVVVVNNAADTESKALLDGLAENHSNIVVCHSPRNLGYFGGLNYGLPYALAMDPEWIVFCNADVIFMQPDFIEQLSQLDVDKGVLALAPAIITRKGRNQNPFFLRHPARIRWLLYDLFFSHYAMFRLMLLVSDIKNSIRGGRGWKPSQLPDTPINIYAPHGACFILNKRYFDIYPKLDDTLMLYGEEIILAETVRRVGGRILYVPTLKVLHNESGNIARHLGRASYHAFEMVRKAHRYTTQRYFLQRGTVEDNPKTKQRDGYPNARLDCRGH